MNENELQNDQHYEDVQGVSRWQMMRVTERWDTLGPDGEPVITKEGSRTDAIDRHLRSNAGFAAANKELEKLGAEEAGRYTGTPLCGVRRVLRYETGASWEVVTDTEPLDELTEILNAQPCEHPTERQSMVRDATFCGRCGATIKPAAP